MIHPVRLNGNLSKVVANCAVPGDTGDVCAYIDSSPYCFRIYPSDFQPGLPDLTTYVGQPVTFVVDQNNYETSRTVGDPFCNFQVAEVVLTANGAQSVFSTPAMTRPEIDGHVATDVWPLEAWGALALVALAVWNVVMEVRLRRRAKLA